MSFLKVGADVDEQIKFFFSRIKNIEGIQKIINLNAEKLLMMIYFSKRSLFCFKRNNQKRRETISLDKTVAVINK